MKGGVLGETETRADRRGRARLRKVAGEWFPTLPAEMLDRIVAAAWMEGRSANGGTGERTAIVAASAVRHHGLRALRGQEVDLPPDAEERVAALTADDPAVPVAVRGQRFRRRARPEALGRRPAQARADDDAPALTPPPTVQRLELPDEDEIERPPTRRRIGRRTEERAAPPARDAGDGAEVRGLRSLRILADTVQIITGRRDDGDREIVEIIAQDAAADSAPEAGAKAAPRTREAPAAPDRGPRHAARADVAAPPAVPAPAQSSPPPAAPPRPEARADAPSRPPPGTDASPRAIADAQPASTAPQATLERPATRPVAAATATALAPAPPAPAPTRRVRASASPATAQPTVRAVAHRPAARRRTQAPLLRRALPFAALIAVVAVVVALVSSVVGNGQDATTIALVRAPAGAGATDIAAVLQTTAAKSRAAQKAAERLAAQRRADALAAKRVAEARAARRAAARRHAAAKRRAAKLRAAHLPPANSVAPPAAPTPQPTPQAPSSSGSSGSWGGEFGP